jgi:hypothetical protein
LYRFRRSNGGDDVEACRGDDHERRRDGGRRRREAEDQIVEIGVVGEPARAIGVDRHCVGDWQNPRQERKADDDAQSTRHGPGAYAGGDVEVHLAALGLRRALSQSQLSVFNRCRFG